MSRKAAARSGLPRGGSAQEYGDFGDVQLSTPMYTERRPQGGQGQNQGQSQSQTHSQSGGNRSRRGRGQQRRNHPSSANGGGGGGHSGNHRRTRRSGSHGGGGGTDYGNGGGISLSFTRESYVKANFTFCLHPMTKSTSLRGQDNLEWDEVESVLVKSDEPVTCPLCLDQVRVPRMTTCGHVFCCVCLYRLFAHATETWEHCPLCQSFINEKGLRRVSDITIIPKVSNGDKVDLLLMARPRAGIVAVPVQSKGGDFAQKKLPNIAVKRGAFSRLLLETKDNVTKVCGREITELQYLMNEAYAYGETLAPDLIRRVYSETQATMARWADPKALESPRDTDSSAPIPFSQTSSAHGTGQSLDNPEEDVHFYQISDGRYIFLDAFNVRCLAHQFGTDKSQYPQKLEQVRVVNVDNVVCTPEVVKRNTFLVHVPIHANLYFVEVDLSSILSEETMNEFREEMKARERRRAAKLKAERRHEKLTKDRLKRQGLLEGNLGYNIDYREYMERRKVQEEEIQRELAHAFEASLTGDAVSEEQINAMLDAASAQQANGIWGSTPAHIGSFASIVNSHGHFPELSSSPPSNSNVLSTSPQSTQSVLSSSPGQANGWAVLSGPRTNPPASVPRANPTPASSPWAVPEAPKGPSTLMGGILMDGGASAGSSQASSKGKGKSKGKKAVLMSTSARRSYR